MSEPPPREPGAAIARNTLHLALGQVGTTLASVVLGAALGRALGAADFGLYWLVSSMAAFAYVFVDWGQATLLVREVARQPERTGSLLGSALALRALLAPGVAGTALAVAWLLGYPPRVLELCALLLVAWLPLTSGQTYGHVFRARERMEYDALGYVLSKGLALAVVLPLLALGGRLLAVTAAQIAVGLGSLAIGVLLARRLGLPPLAPDRAVVREVAVGGVPFLAMALTISAQPYLDAVVLSKLAAADAVGWYGAARNLMNTLVMPAVLLAAAAFPRFSRAADDLARFQREVQVALRPLLGLGALGAAGTALFGGPVLVLVYGPAFAPAGVLLQVFAPVLLLVFVDVLLANALQAAGISKQLAVAKLLNVGASTGLGLLLVPLCQARYGNGGVGVVLAFGGSELSMLAAILWLAPRGTLHRGLLADLARALAAGAGTLLLFALLPPLPLVLGLPLCVAAFLALAVGLGLVGAGDLRPLAGALRGR